MTNWINGRCPSAPPTSCPVCGVEPGRMCREPINAPNGLTLNVRWLTKPHGERLAPAARAAK